MEAYYVCEIRYERHPEIGAVTIQIGGSLLGVEDGATIPIEELKARMAIMLSEREVSKTVRAVFHKSHSRG